MQKGKYKKKYVKVLCLVIVNVKCDYNYMPQKCQIVYERFVVFQALNTGTPKSFFGRGSASDPAGGAYDASQTPYTAKEGDTPVPNSAAPRLSGPPTQISGYAYAPNEFTIALTPWR